MNRVRDENFMVRGLFRHPLGKRNIGRKVDSSCGARDTFDRYVLFGRL